MPETDIDKLATGYPKILCDTTDQLRDNRPVHNAVEEVALRKEGFTRVLTAHTALSKVTAPPELPRMVYHREHGFRTVRSITEYYESKEDGWQDKPFPEEPAAAGPAVPVPQSDLEARVAALELRVAGLENRVAIPKKRG